MTEDLSWADQRRKNAQARAQMLQAQEAADSAQAAGYLRQFVAAATRLGPAAEALVVRNPVSGRTAKTAVRGWYLKEDRSVAVGDDGQYYLLTAPLTLWDTFRTVSPKVVAPPLILGKGGRDGESIDLTEALSKRIPSWQEY